MAEAASAYDPTSLGDLCTIQQVAENIYRCSTVFDDSYNLYGSQVAARAVVAASRT